MKDVIIFGTKDTAQLAKYYITTDPNYDDYNVVAFTADSDHIEAPTFEGLPVVPFEEVEKTYSPDNFYLFAPLTGIKMNEVRKDVYNRGKAKGYKFMSYISSKATVFNNKIGENCFILEDNTLQPFTSIGNNVVMWSGNHIGHHGVIEDHVFFTSHVVMSGHCHIGERAWLGVNSTLRDGINIGEGTLIAMGSLITKDTQLDSFYMGSPAKLQTRKSYEVY
tara:strand:- start:1885 stop:2547 length:663 start_codon:yes stop_codon:yes gene_type:complete